MFIISRPGRAEEEKTQFSRTFTHHFQSMIIIHGASFVTCILPPLLATNASCLATPRYSGSSHSWRQSDFRLLWCSGWKSMKGDRDRRGRSYLCDILSGWEWVAGWLDGWLGSRLGARSGVFVPRGRLVGYDIAFFPHSHSHSRVWPLHSAIFSVGGVLLHSCEKFEGLTEACFEESLSHQEKCPHFGS